MFGKVIAYYHSKKNATHRFLKYFVVGGSTFAFDLFLLFFFTDFLGFYYIFSASLSFIVAVSVNYILSRKYVFSGTLRSLHGGYLIFLLIGGVGLALVAGLMYALVNYLGFYYLYARVLVAGVVGIWNYLMNLYVNFRVAGK